VDLGQVLGEGDIAQAEQAVLHWQWARILAASSSGSGPDRAVRRMIRIAWRALGNRRHGQHGQDADHRAVAGLGTAVIGLHAAPGQAGQLTWSRWVCRASAVTPNR
jgi:hypothetical protein